jgi:phosphate:Na+ symporter
MLTGFFVSTIFTAIIQSSGATIGMLFALSSAGVFTDFSQIFPWVLGAHVGTCATPLLGSLGAEVAAKRTALAHFLFNLIGSFVAMLMYKFYSWSVPLLSGDLLRQVANVHTLVQLVNALLLLPLSKQYCKFLVKCTPTTQPDPEQTHLDDKLLVTPEKAIVAAFLELRRMSVVARHMFQEAMKGFLEVDKQRFLHVSRCEEILDSLKDAIHTYLITLAERDLSRRQAIIIQYLTSAASDLERIGDHVDNIAKITSEKIERKVWFRDRSVQDLIDLYKKADSVLALLVQSFEPAFYDAPAELAQKILDKRNEFVQLSYAVKEKQNVRLLEKIDDPLAGMFFFRLVVCFDKLVKHSKTIALVEKERFFFIKKHKMEKTASVREREDTHDIVPLQYDHSMFEE